MCKSELPWAESGTAGRRKIPSSRERLPPRSALEGRGVGGRFDIAGNWDDVQSRWRTRRN